MLLPALPHLRLPKEKMGALFFYPLLVTWAPLDSRGAEAQPVGWARAENEGEGF
jgi:hypothetical protein